MTALDLRLDPDIVRTDRRRGHRFQPPKADLARVPILYATEKTPTEDKTIWLHYFLGSWDWWVAELNPESFEAFGLVRSSMCPDGEWGYFDLAELATSTASSTIMGRSFPQPVERDCWWEPKTVKELRK